MARVIMKNACCGFGQLRYGAIIIATISAKICLVIIISSIVNLSDGSISQAVDEAVNASEAKDIDKEEIKNIIHTATTSVFVILLVWSLIQIACNILVIIAAWKRNHYFLLPWLWFSMIMFVLYAFVTLLSAGSLMIAAKVFAGFLVLLLFLGIPGAIFIYMWCIVYSYYAILQEENNRGLYDKQPYRR